MIETTLTPLICPRFLHEEKYRQGHIRIINALPTEFVYGKIRKEGFRAFGKMLHINLDSYNNDFNRSLQDSMGLDKHLKVFEEMMEIMKERFNMV
jgi:hypothetical protein